MREIGKWLTRLAAVLMASALASGCATLGGSTAIDLGPFSENTVEMVGELQKLNRPTVWTHLDKYRGLASVAAAEQSTARVRTLMRGVALYSAQVVALHDSPLSEREKVAELARYVDEIIRPGVTSASPASFHITQGYMDTLVEDIRGCGHFLTALGATQPLVSLTVSAGDILLDQATDDMAVATGEIEAEIDQEFGPMKLRLAELDEMNLSSIRSYRLIQLVRAGDAAALDTLRATDAGVRGYLRDGHSPTIKELDEAERYDIERTATITTMREHLGPEFTLYKEHQAELAELRNLSDERARLGRATLYLWSHAHRNLAAGIPVPPMIDVVGIVKGTVETGIRGVIP